MKYHIEIKDASTVHRRLEIDAESRQVLYDKILDSINRTIDPSSVVGTLRVNVCYTRLEQFKFDEHNKSLKYI